MGEGASPRAIRLSKLSAPERRRLLHDYRTEIYEPAFPDASIREDTRYWLDLLDADPYPPPPQPRIEVVLLADGDAIIAGVTIEYYRIARCGLLTYISAAPAWRGRGLGRRLVAAARETLDTMAGERAPMFAETERLEDAVDQSEAAETVLRQKRLAGLGARQVVFDYVMPPLRPESEPHRLHLLFFDADKRHRDLAASQVIGLMRELAAALGANLDASPDTVGMMRFLAAADRLPLAALPVADTERP